MAENANPTPPAQGDDRLTNLQAEFNRKLENQQAELKKLSDTNAALADQLKKVTPKPAPKEPQDEPLDQLFYKDPVAHAAKIKEMTKQEMREEFRRENEANQRMAGVINRLGQEYPEYNDPESTLTKKTLEIFGKMEESDKKNPTSLRVAALEAAQELGVKPRSKRTDDDESFSMSGGGYSGNRSNRDQARPGKLDQRTEDLAALVGLKITDPKVKERLTQRAQRKNYRNYQSNK